MKYFTHLVIVGLIATACSAAGQSPGTVPPATVVSPTSMPPVATTDAPDPPVTTTSAPTTTAAPDNGCEPLSGGLDVGTNEVVFFANCDGSAHPVVREAGDTGLESALQALVSGLTQEERHSGLHTGFEEVAERAEIDVVASIDDGLAEIDFVIGQNRWQPGQRASTSSQLLSFIDPIYATVFAFPEVDALDLSTMCWGEADCSGTLEREVWEATVFLNDGLIVNAGCDVLLAVSSPECRVDATAFIDTAAVANVATDDTLNLRAGPGVNYLVVAEVGPSDDLRLSDRFFGTEDGAEWRLVQTESGDIGWVNEAFLDA
ncbi:MAG: hypothetical protein HKN07_12715 [Acidimicrobiia bacterium]|nr:hypothetical protein [Acidimicrobiia bacterium]